MFRAVLIAALAAVVGAYLAQGARAATCSGAPAGVRAEYPEPRVFTEAQSWWLEGTGDPLNVEGAMEANHVHLGLCYPQGETILAEDGLYPWSLQGKLHEFGGGSAGFVRGGGFLEPGATWSDGSGASGFPWSPVVPDETTVFTEATRAAKVVRCGRRENRFTLNATGPQGRRQFQSFGLQTYVPCTSGRSREDYRSSDVMIFRSWYEGADYTNVSLVDESAHAYSGFQASGMADPVPLGWRVKVKLAAGANRYLVAVDPDLHHGTFGVVVARGVGTSVTPTIPVSVLQPGVHKLMVMGCERIAQPSGSACALGVIPFVVG